MSDEYEPTTPEQIVTDDAVVLAQNDRVLFGNNHLFRLNDPKVVHHSEIVASFTGLRAYNDPKLVQD